MRPRRPLSSPPAIALLAAALLACAGTCFPAPQDDRDKVKDDDTLNFAITVPGTWSWGDPAPFAEKFSVKVLAERKLELLADKKTPAEGQGARAMLSVQDVPASFESDYETWLRDLWVLETDLGKMEPPTPATPNEAYGKLEKQIEEMGAKIVGALRTLAGTPEVQSLLLHRFGEAGKGKAKVDPDYKIDTLPAALVTLDGTCNNMAAVPAKCEGRMFVWVIRKRLYRLAIWCWPTARDAEHLRMDVEQIDLNFTVPKKDPIIRRPDDKGGKGPGAPGTPPEPAPTGMTPAKWVTELPFGFKVHKPEKWREKSLDRSKADERYMGFQFDSAATREGDHAIVDLLVYRVETGNVVGFSPDDHFTRSWGTFLVGHPAGALEAWPFPGISNGTPFLSLPDSAKKKDVKRPASPTDPTSRSDLERMGIVTEAKGASIKKQKLRFPWRFAMAGPLERQGQEGLVQYVFSTGKITFLLRVTVRRDGLKMWDADLKDILSSFEILE